MIKSQLILDILDLASEDDPETNLLKQQVNFLTEDTYEHTGIGLFIHLKHEPEIAAYKMNEEFNMLVGIIIKNESEGIFATATVHLINGIIDCVEILNCLDDYPTIEPKVYEVYQDWPDTLKRRVIIRPAFNNN